MGENLKEIIEKFGIAYPPGIEITKRKIIRCSGDYWYKNLIGQNILVHHFATFGVWDLEGRWISFYDVSGPIEN